jgi:flagellar biosynthesis protein FlhG
VRQRHLTSNVPDSKDFSSMTVSGFATPYRPRDQARGLRSLIDRQRRPDGSTSALTERTCRTVVLAGGKGGTGKSFIAWHLAHAVAARPQRVCLIDASSSMGTMELLAGRAAYWNLTHVVSGARRLDEVVQHLPEGIQLLSGAAALSRSGPLPINSQQLIWEQLCDLEQTFDLIIVDAGSGWTDTAAQLSAAADRVLVVVTPDALSVAEGYSTIKSLMASPGPEIQLLLNRSTSTPQAERIHHSVAGTVSRFLHKQLEPGATLPEEALVETHIDIGRADRSARSALSPPCAAAFQRLANDILWQTSQRSDVPGFFARWSTVQKDRRVIDDQTRT